MEAPEVRYAKSGDVNIAYSVVGEGPFDLVFVVGWVISTLEYAWEGPPAEFFRRLASFSRLILLDKRGTGLSDRVTGIPDLETRMDDVRAVMDAIGSKRAAVMGVSEGGPMTALFAATYPERTAAAILYGTGATYLRSDDYPWASTREEYLRFIEERERRWGEQEYMQELLEYFAPSIAHDETVRRWWPRYVRTSASPGAAAARMRMNMEMDVRQVLLTIGVPTLVLHFAGEKVFDVHGARYMAERIPGAELVELPGEDHAWFVKPEPVAREVERFLRGIWDRGEWDVVETDRVLATILFTDIVGSTAKAAELGDRGWRELLGRHHALVRRHLVRFRGRELDTAGDGFFASFDGPARAIRCASTIRESVRELGLEVRAGLHTGECELMAGKVGGIAVHIGARVAAEAQPGEVLVSSTVKDLVAGSGIRFRERGVSTLKGLPGEWRLYAVEGTEEASPPP
ncbi:MAG: adenylate/guanylate cyclase domain-containing protein [Armatimonadetes bacterium]|nr:adenylate/guanylate cyclase domain-containing protein [Armatimonadota bacterium]